MRKLDFWNADWFLGFVVALIAFIASYGDLIQSLERTACGPGVRAAVRRG